MEENYQNLANAIIERAAIDYKRVLRLLKMNPHNKKERVEKRRLEIFFSSSWFQILSNLNGKQLAKDIREFIRREAV